MSKAVVLLSGGLDSATTLAIAKNEGYECYALSVNYHQRHIAELEAAKKIALLFKVQDHKTVEMNLSWMLTSALTNPDSPKYLKNSLSGDNTNEVSLPLIKDFSYDCIAL